MYRYNSNTGQVIRISDNKVVSPVDSATDPDFLAYNEWAIQGGICEQISEEYVSVPISVTRRQMLLALHRAGILDTIKQAISSSGNTELQISYEEALDFERTNPFIVAIATQLGFTTNDIDNLFIQASTL